MRIGGFLKQSLIDYPGNIASVVFTQACNFRCFYCHNPELVLPELIDKSGSIPLIHILEYIERNRNLLDAVVITGGEPTVHKSLPEFIQKIKSLGLKVKLDTNGTNPEMLEQLIRMNLVDYVAMDIKAPLILEKYQKIVGKQFSFSQLENVLASIRIIQQSVIQFEFRSTLVKNIHSYDDIKQMADSVQGKIFFQKYNSVHILQPECKSYESYTNQELQDYLKMNKIAFLKIR